MASHPALKTGQCVVMDGHNLSAKHVIHTVGPRVRGGRVTSQDESDLAAAVSAVLSAAAGAGAVSIAIPCISTGIFGFPVQSACDIIVRVCREYCACSQDTSLRSILLIDIDQSKVDALRQEEGSLRVNWQP
ncbi:hypothetical protein KIPB_015515 [Kipferlia bialata]|uniref:Macro domain-containing protein n=1 Tax=Kipferlia bialata TaxID=797122 RepID=A0A391P483_9EUKA|nr:hypothetical protein KIPB_015515 [Kipferlia bialata]|eukprot:g15515.t1